MDDEVVETGLVTAAVTLGLNIEPEPVPTVPLPALIEVALTPKVPMPEGWTLQKVAVLVDDLAQNLYDTPYILKKHMLSEEQFNFLRSNEFFKRALEDATLTWNSANSVQKRLALQTALAIENAMPTVAARLQKPTEPLVEIVALLKVFAEISGLIGAKAVQQQPNTEKFKITINLGGDQVVNREASVTPFRSLSVQPQPEGPGAHVALQPFLPTP